MSRRSPEVLLSEVPAYAGARLSPFGGGSANALYRIDPSEPRALLRVHGAGARMDTDRAAERLAWQGAARAGLTPELLYWDPTHRFSIVELWGSRAEVLAPVQAAELLARFHQLPIAPARLDYAGGLGPQGAALQQQLLASRLRPGMTHHDPSRGNWLSGSHQGQQRLRLIDFEYAGFGHPLWDLACLMLEWPDMASAAPAYYRAVGVDVDAREQAALHAAGQLYLLTCLSWCRQALAKGGDPAQLTPWADRYRQLLAQGLASRLPL
ncbi:hypothetical protein FCL40_05540 [Ferrimonas sediminicola]|uniref:Aminoglycoside phosphotransferase domain-containing protein n=1 Tax=Ferrimonas sediminicola TaxID=2569538 RepID=A0A4U1BHR5_9GAMM|nr:phosphotransferase [Ferrimonas sediminicola]TKB50614.1 hypothetical protein FCL40_05540 [Ferrimonas sediminicola]